MEKKTNTKERPTHANIPHLDDESIFDVGKLLHIGTKERERDDDEGRKSTLMKDMDNLH